MTTEETSKILSVVMIAYPSYRPTDKVGTLNLWHEMLEDYDYKVVGMAIKTIIATDKSEFAPPISKVIDTINGFKNPVSDTESEAWQIVRKAIARGNYHSEEDFNNFSPTIQKAVGSPTQLRVWASDPNFNEGVESSNFKRVYRTVSDREKQMENYPNDVRNFLAQTKQKMLEGETT